MSKYDETLKNLAINIDWNWSSENFKILQNLIYKVEILEEALGCVIDKMIEFKDWMAKCIQLEQELLCPLDVVFKALKQGYIYFCIRDKFFTTRKLKLVYYDEETFNVSGNWGFVSEDYEGAINLLLFNYKKTWWLKKDKSE